MSQYVTKLLSERSTDERMSLEPGWGDPELLLAAQNGNAQAFAELYERHARAVFRYLYAHLDNYLDAEDLTGEVFLRAWQSLPRYDERGVPFLAFLLRIARNAVVDHYRRNKHGEMDVNDTMETTLRDPRPGPAELSALRTEHQELMHHLSGLREDYQTVLILRFISDLSPEETAQAMERSIGSVRVLQHRALAAIRKTIIK